MKDTAKAVPTFKDTLFPLKFEVTKRAIFFM